MLPSGLVREIKTLQERIEQHRPALSQSEALTRYALIDPLLRELGWDTADPDLVTPEYTVSGKRADYALLESGNVVVFLEAKKLEENLSHHRSQVVAYASELGIRYPALTNGNDWEVYDNSQFVPIDQRRILTLSLTGAPPAVNALQLLLLWRPNLASGEPVAAKEPILTPKSEVDTDGGQKPPIGEGWVSLSDFQPKTKAPPPLAIRFSSGEERSCQFWWEVLASVAEWLITAEKLTAKECPVQVSGVGGKKHIIHIDPSHSDGKKFQNPHRLSNFLYMEKHGVSRVLVRRMKSLLQHCGEDVGTVSLKFN